ncbi:MAG: APC family permease [Nitrososphaerota archaeon]|nr:APC family permease [Nitrososphaerota archaeon]
MAVFPRPTSGLVREISAPSAIVYNMAAMGLPFMFIYTVWALVLFPGVYLPVTALYAILLGIPSALIYYLLSVSMPRSGGDYVWNSRILHPSIGFMTNLALTFALLVAIGVEPSWAMQWGIAPIASSLGILTGDASYIALAETLASPETITIIGVIYFVLIAVLITRGTKTVMRIHWILFSISILGAVVYVVTLLSAGHATFVSRFNQLSGMKYDEVIKIATELGYPKNFDPVMTYFGVVYTFLTLTAFWFTSYIGGEIKEVGKSQLIAIPGSLIVLSIGMFIVYYVTYVVFDGIFLGSLSYLSVIGHEAYKLPYPTPFPHFLMPFVTDNIVAIALVNIGFAVTPLLAGLAYIFLIIRNLFAWAFDRVIPIAFTKVHPKTRSPYVASILIVILSLIFQFMWLYTTVFQYVLYITTILFIIIWITSLSAIIFPYKRKDIFEVSPPIVKAKVGGVPLLVILGVISLAVSSFIIYATLTPAYGGVLDPINLFYNMLIFPFGLVIYFAASLYRRKTGIPLELSFKEIPPA